MKQSILVLVIAMLAAACASAGTPSAESATLPPDTVITSPADTDPNNSETSEVPSYLPNPGDTKLQRGNVFISESGIILRESFPVQVVLGLSGELPTPCHQLRVTIKPPDAENQILVEAYTVVNPEINCIQVLKPFQEMIELGTFPSGHYTVWVNGTQVGEFDS
jgi:hypothetical protein